MNRYTAERYDGNSPMPHCIVQQDGFVVAQAHDAIEAKRIAALLEWDQWREGNPPLARDGADDRYIVRIDYGEFFGVDSAWWGRHGWHGDNGPIEDVVGWRPLLPEGVES